MSLVSTREYNPAPLSVEHSLGARASTPLAHFRTALSHDGSRINGDRG